jgi:hypothetical protein
MKYPDALQREGTFGDITEQGWRDANDSWVNDYGREDFSTPIGLLKLEASDDEIKAWASEYNVPESDVRIGHKLMVNMANYSYWKTRSRIESTPEMVRAHRALYEGMDLFRHGKHDDREVDGKTVPSEAEVKVVEGLTAFSELFKKYPELLDEDDTIEEVMLGLICWKYIYQLNVNDFPNDFPLKSLWMREQDRVSNLNNVFRSEYSRIRVAN